MNTQNFFKLLLIFTLFAQNIFAQTDQKAQLILLESYANYRTYNNVKLNFTVINEHKERNLYQSHDGTAYVSGKKHVVELPDQQVITDGTNVWTYNKTSKQILITKYNPNDGMITPDEIFREDFLTSGLIYKYLETKTQSNDLTTNKNAIDQIEFTPKDKKRKYTKFIISIDQKTKLMTNWKVFLNNGGTVTYKMKITPNVNVASNFFTFDKAKYPKDVQVSDFRKN